jgi:hypothetical protein
MELINKKFLYLARNENDSLKIEGEVQVSSEVMPITFNGSFYSLDGIQREDSLILNLLMG